MGRVVLLAIHGMGKTKRKFAKKLKKSLATEMGAQDWQKVVVKSVYYQDILQKNQTRTMQAMRREPINWIGLREFMLYGFSDAAGLERRSGHAGSPYHRTQQVIRGVLSEVYDELGGAVPVVIIAQSLGGQVISNYLWDAQQAMASQGTWKFDPAEEDAEKERFLRLKTLGFLFTTGCNIPIFLAGFPQEEIKAICTQGDGYDFKWRNFYDADDILGWPLQPLSDSYRRAVDRDIPVDAASSLGGLRCGG